MSFFSINPYNGQLNSKVKGWDANDIEGALANTYQASLHWKRTNIEERCQLMFQVARVIRKNKTKLAETITLEMGKLIGEAEGEVEKCANVAQAE